MKDFTLVNINYENEPDLKILDAIHIILCSIVNITIIFKNNYYIDSDYKIYLLM